MRRTFCILASFEHESGRELPSEDKVAAALSHSTAAEALSEATGCEVSMWIPTLDELKETADGGGSGEGLANVGDLHDVDPKDDSLDNDEEGTTNGE